MKTTTYLLLTLSFTVIIFYLSSFVICNDEKDYIGKCKYNEDICKEQGNKCCRWTPPTGRKYISKYYRMRPIEQCYRRKFYSCIEDESNGDSCLCPRGLHCCTPWSML